MIKKIRDILIVTLALQIVIAALQISKDYRYSIGYEIKSVLHEFNVDELQNIAINDVSRNLVFEKKLSKWFLKENNSPIITKKINELITKIKTIKLARPLIASKVTPSRFNVGAKNYSKKVVFSASNSLTIFFGESSTSSSSYLRFGGGSEVYEINFRLQDLDINLETWMEHRLLPPKESIARVSMGKLTIKNKNDIIKKDSTLASLDKAKKVKLLALLENLTANYYGETFKLSEKNFTKNFFSLETKEGNKINYHIFLDYKDSYSILHRADSGRYFKVSKKQVMEILSILEDINGPNAR